jgi:hypothetical protein
MRVIALSVWVIIISTFLMGGCASDNSIRSFTQKNLSSMQVVKLPELNIVAEAEVGQSMVSTANRTIIPAIKVIKEISISSELKGLAFNKDALKQTLVIPQGVFVAVGTNSDEIGSGVYYHAPIAYMRNLEGNYNIKAGVFLPDNTASPEIFDLGTGSKILNSGFAAIYKVDKIDFEKTQIEQWGRESFKRELVYSGVSQNTISIRYREFKDDMARPAFTEDLKYDLSQGDIIGYNGARFQILKATNIGIRFKVLKHLE